jgi:hypothetical protein
MKKQLRFNVIKTEVCFSVEKMDLYVAPTYINLDNPTFWVSQLGDSYEGKSGRDAVPNDNMQRVESLLSNAEPIFYLARDTNVKNPSGE